MAECSECGDEFTVDDGYDDDGLCHPCAHDLAAGVVATRAARDKADELLVDLRAHVDKLAAILDEVTPCDDDCDLAAVLAWVDPADRRRVHELRGSGLEQLNRLKRSPS